MLPSILAKQLQKGIGDYIETTFPMTNEPFKSSVQKMLADKGSVAEKSNLNTVKRTIVLLVKPKRCPYWRRQTLPQAADAREKCPD